MGVMGTARYIILPRPHAFQNATAVSLVDSAQTLRLNSMARVGQPGRSAKPGPEAGDLVAILSQVETTIRNSGLPATSQGKAIAYLNAARQEAEEPEPDKGLMAKNLQHMGDTLTAANVPLQRRQVTLNSARGFAPVRCEGVVVLPSAAELSVKQELSLPVNIFPVFTL